MPTEIIEVHTVLFDMDGTLIDSTPAVNAVWKVYCKEHDLDYDYIVRHAHGVRTVENLRRFCPRITEAELPKEVVRFEGMILEFAEKYVAAQARKKANGSETGGDAPSLGNGHAAGVNGIGAGTAEEEEEVGGAIVAMPGAKELIAQIQAGAAENPSRRPGWAIVTSATKIYAHRAFPTALVSPTLPKTFITSDDCTRGKPDPLPYLLGAERSGAPIADCLVVEDAPPGVRSGRAAGAKVLGLRTTHGLDDEGKVQWEAGADFVVGDLSKVSARWEGEKLLITMEVDEKPRA